MTDIRVVRYEQSRKEEWNTFVYNAKNSLCLHVRDYMDYHNDRFKDHSLLFIKDEKIVALLPANESNGTLFSHGGLTYGGLILDTKIKQHTVNSCFDSLIEYLNEVRLSKVIYKPIPHIFHTQPAEEDLYSLFQRNAKLAEIAAATVIDLKTPLKMPKGRKAQISRAKREGVVVELLNSKSDYEAFINLENQVLEEHHGVQAVHTADELFLLHDRFPDNIHLFGALLDEMLIAGTVIFECPNAIHTQYMASNDLGRKLGALDLTISEVMNRYCKSKQWLDFGISTEDHGRYLNEGLISQKEGFGGRTNIYTVWELNNN